MGQRGDVISGQEMVWGQGVVQLCAEGCGKQAEEGSCYCAGCEATFYAEEEVVAADSWSKGGYETGLRVCADCGGKYRPAGGPCIHEHPAPRPNFTMQVTCGLCQAVWRPGHTCLVQSNREWRGIGCATPANWEAV